MNPRKRDEDMTDEEVIAEVVRRGQEMVERFIAATVQGKTLGESFDATGRPVGVRVLHASELRELGEALLDFPGAPLIIRKIWVYRTLDRKGAFALGYQKRADFVRDGFVQVLGLIDNDEDKQ